MSADAYLEAKAAFERVNAAVSNLAVRVAKVGDALKQNRSSFCFSNSVGGFPAQVVMGHQTITDDGNTWPTAAAINTALTEWHAARQAMYAAYDGVPQDRRTGLVPPPR